MLLAYLNLYQEKAENPFSDIDSISLLYGTQNGIDWVEALFSGKVSPEADAVYRLASSYDLQSLVGDTAGKLLTFMLDSLKETYGLDVAIQMVKCAFDKLKYSILPEWLRAFYAVCGCNLSCVKDDFDDMINFIFPTNEIKNEYAPIIEKATYVNKNVTTRTAEILKNAKANGVRVGVVGGYGQQTPPLNKKASYVGDSLLSLEDQTLGATCAKVDGTLDKKYINSQIGKQLGAYISPDRQVDTSTAAFPETTWVIKNANHYLALPMNQLMIRFIRENIDVTDEIYPGFLNYLATDFSATYTAFSEPPYGTLTPMKEHNENDYPWKNGFKPVDVEEEPEGFFEKIIYSFKIFFETIKNYFNALFALFG